MKNVRLIIQREVFVRVRKKSFLLATFLTPLLFAGMLILPFVLVRLDTGTHENVAVVDYSNVLAQNLNSDDAITFYHFADTLSANANTLLNDSSYSAVLIIGADAVDNPRNVSLFTLKPATLQLSEPITSQLEDAIEMVRIQRYNIENLRDIMQEVKASVSLRTVTFDEKGEEIESSVMISVGIGYVLGFFAYMLIFITGSMVMNGVIEEKNSRIVEVLVSTVRTFDLMIGKILGIAAVFLLQIAIWIVLTLLLTFGASVFIALGDPASLAAPAMEASPEVSGQVMSLLQNDILAPLANVPFGYILSTSLFFILFGYLAYAALYAAVGSAVEEASDAAQLTTPITIPLIVGMFAMLLAIKNPDSQIIVWLSLIPLTSPVVMPVRLAFTPPAWQVILSGLLLIATFFLLTWLASKVYRRGVLMYGKKYGWKDMLQWLRGS